MTAESDETLQQLDLATDDGDIGETDLGVAERRFRPPMEVEEDGENLLRRVDDAEPAPPRGRDPLGQGGHHAGGDVNESDNSAEWSEE